MNDTEANNTRTRWGRIRFAGGHLPAMAIAIPAGLVLGAGVGAIAHLAGAFPGQNALLIAGVFALVMSGSFAGLVWVIIVDRSSLHGAPSRPEESVEASWLDEATSGAFRDTITLTGGVLAALAITRFELDALWALSGVLLVASFSTIARYLMAKNRT